MDDLKILTRADAWEWLTQDLRQRGAVVPDGKIRVFHILLDPINYFMFLLRMNELSRNGTMFWPVKMAIRVLFRRQSIRLGFSIPPNVFGPGLAIVHYGTIVVNSAARIGPNCRIHVDVNIGGKAGFTTQEVARSLAPRIGANVYIAPGAKIYGPIEIGDNCVIGANAVVNKSHPKRSVTLAGVPARVVSDTGSQEMIFLR